MIVTLEPLTLSVSECCRLANVCRDTWNRWVKEGIAPKPINEAQKGKYYPKLWSRAEVMRFLRSPDNPRHG